MNKICTSCKKEVDTLNEHCKGCGFTLVLEPDEKLKVRYLRGPALGALLFTQGWTFGARTYLWFLISLIPVFGIIALFACLLFGRRWSWEHGGWSSWEEFQERMKLMDGIGVAWVALLLGIYLYFRLL
ncbi:MAG: hypothetical protein HQ488_01595 [Parcubacteria group bacterium]|nr:hypothetical protein [Parcubacteria group bacterium]